MSNLSYLSEYSPFKSTQELNAAVDEHIRINNCNLNGTDRDVLMMLAQYSVKYDGVAHLKADTIAKHIGKSKRTVQRCIRKLEQLHVIERKSFLRKITGGHGANIYVFMSPNVRAEMSPREDSPEPTQDKEQGNNTANEPITSISARDIDINVSSEPSTSSHKPAYKRFTDVVKAFIGEGNKRLIYRLYGVYLAQTKALRKAYADSELIDIAIRGLGAMFHASKQKDIRNIAGYYNGVLSNMYDAMCTQVMGELWASS